MSYEIGEFAKKVNLTIDTLRYYEKEGLIKPQRAKNGHRQFLESDLKWVEFIKRLKLTGMPIKDIKKYAELRRKGNSTIDERMLLLGNQQKLLLGQQTEIQSHLDFLAQKIKMYQNMKNDLNKS
ncbi:MerR family transcriptional regulator [Xylocopilactobacillus apis]|uniref:MerR family transcriptional regulator n=1 Tax=Xylocopilactobacillus apis TaxID=2932183 RepID=A0AAU9D0F7_9LACO|nr:MerR family transcriptional regulator [Xylocopilactobacillus apis]BDR56006.1 MerR family transcriptional regulator [Xylocopilactobacillus apis]